MCACVEYSIFFSILVGYSIDFMNSTGEEATIKYGEIHDCWSPSNPNSVVDKGHIMVYIILIIRSCSMFNFTGYRQR